MHRAFSLLTEGRTLLLEVGTDVRVRYAAQVVESRPERWLRIQLAESAAPAARRVGDDASLIIPVSHCVWVFPAEILESTAPDDRTYRVAWPEVAEQLGGRQAPRAERMLPIRCLADGDEQPRWIATYTLDLGYGGLRIAYPRGLERGAPLRVELPVQQRLLTAEGTVAWQRPLLTIAGDAMFTLGVQLQSLSENARFRLYTLVHAAARQAVGGASEPGPARPR